MWEVWGERGERFLPHPPTPPTPPTPSVCPMPHTLPITIFSAAPFAWGAECR
nr:hypothetical protein [Nostoc sp. ChiSLP01]